ncbi:hypothetical protein E4U55_004782 [Claviceps digitariae]|nr:hypothetical protein E4U55_004782 [Claviceps digitariae]
MSASDRTSTHLLTNVGKEQQEHRKRSPGLGEHGASNSRTRSHSASSPAATPANLGVDELFDVFSKLSAEAPPDTRIIIAGPPLQYAGQLVDPSPSTVILPHTVAGREIARVGQRMTDADFLLSLSFDLLSQDPSLQKIRSRIDCRIYYNPQSDFCQLCNEGDAHIHVMKVSLQGGSEGAFNCLYQGQSCWISTGIWSISVAGEDKHHHHVVEFLLLQRRFVVSEIDVTRKRSFQQVLLPGERDNTNQVEMQFVLAPRRTAGNSSANSVVMIPANLPCPRVTQSGTMSVLQLSRQRFLRIQDSNCTHMIQQPNGMVSSYTLAFRYQIDETDGSKVFACCHSALHGTVVAKAPNFTKEVRGGPSLWKCVSLWKEECELLNRLDHPNIVKLKSFDARLLVLYLEHLPLCLSRQMPMPLTAARAVLVDISAALKYLEEQKIVHNDIKPSNIAYSPERGAVLFDFGFATAEGAHRYYGGTYMFLPPEFVREVEVAKRRGPFSDIWALAITILICTGKMGYPRYHEKMKVLHNMGMEGTEDYAIFKKWLVDVSDVRRTLDIQDDMETTIYRMLDERVEWRIKAAQIVDRLKR